MRENDVINSGSDSTRGVLERATPILDFLDEFRKRIFTSLAAVLVFGVVAFLFSETLMRVLMRPLGETQLYNMEVTGTFYAYLKVSLFTGILASLPIVFYQVWSLASSILRKRQQAFVLGLVLVSTLLFAAGMLFCYFAVLPLGLKFLVGFGEETVSNIITVSNYVGFSGIMLLAFGATFELPVLAYFLGKMRIITPRVMSRFRRYAIVIILVVAAILTPTPDVATQMLLAVPMYLLYESSIGIVAWIQRHDR